MLLVLNILCSSYRVNDQIIKVNNIDVTNADCHRVVQAILNSHGSINMVIRRRKPTITRAVQPVHLNLSGGKGNLLPGIQHL